MIQDNLAGFAEMFRTYMDETVLDPGDRQLLEWFTLFIQNEICPSIGDMMRFVESGDRSLNCLRELFGEINKTKTVIV